MRAGCTMHQALLLILAMSLLYIPLNLWLFGLIGITGVVLVDIILYTSINLLINYKISKAE